MSSRNTRLAWLAVELAKGKSNAAIVVDCMTAFHGVNEKTVRRDLKDILQRFTEIENDTIEEARTKFMEVGWKLLNETRSVAQYGPAVNLFKTLAAISGLLDSDRGGTISTPGSDGSLSGSPEAKLVRDRIAQLLKNRSVQSSAKEAGIDLLALKKAD